MSILGGGFYGSMFVFSYVDILSVVDVTQCSYFLLCFERIVPHDDHFGDSHYYDPGFSTCGDMVNVLTGCSMLWFTWACMTTVGLGDWYPLTRVGRFIAVCAQGWGMIVSAMLVGVVVTRFEFSQEESNVPCPPLIDTS
mmetsp:Transcript_17216/g.37322  ORF Transcript_17216/g.37322 Transcript_17216/m.37322 type:complete len:139 (+) Transcript_17216:391-807(+)